MKASSFAGTAREAYIVASVAREASSVANKASSFAR